MGMDEEERIAAAVRSILKSADMNVITEAKVRKLASEETGIDLSQKRYKQRVQELIEEFLVSEDAQGDSEAEGEQQAAPAESREEDGENEEEVAVQPEKKAKHSPTEEEGREDAKGARQERTRMDDGALLICQLTSKRNVTVSDWKGVKLVSVREFYEKDGQTLPGKGISLTRDQWNEMKKGLPAIADAIQTLKNT